MSKSDQYQALVLKLVQLEDYLEYCQQCMQGPTREDRAWGTSGYDHTRNEIARLEAELAALDKK